MKPSRTSFLYALALGVVLGAALIIATPLYAAESNFNNTADAAAADKAQSNANCNAAIQLGCDNDEGTIPQTTPDPGIIDIVNNGYISNGREWDVGREAFPGSENGRANTVSWMSGQTNAVFSAPSPTIGSIAVVFLICAIASTFIYRKTPLSATGLPEAPILEWA